MNQRKVKDAIDLISGERVYFKGHAKATYMSDGKTVEDAINSIGTGGGGVSQEYVDNAIANAITSTINASY